MLLCSSGGASMAARPRAGGRAPLPTDGCCGAAKCQQQQEGGNGHEGGGNACSCVRVRARSALHVRRLQRCKRNSPHASRPHSRHDAAARSERAVKRGGKPSSIPGCSCTRSCRLRMPPLACRGLCHGAGQPAPSHDRHGECGADYLACIKPLRAALARPARPACPTLHVHTPLHAGWQRGPPPPRCLEKHGGSTKTGLSWPPPRRPPPPRCLEAGSTRTAGQVRAGICICLCAQKQQPPMPLQARLAFKSRTHTHTTNAEQQSISAASCSRALPSHYSRTCARNPTHTHVLLHAAPARTQSWQLSGATCGRTARGRRPWCPSCALSARACPLLPALSSCSHAAAASSVANHWPHSKAMS